MPTISIRSAVTTDKSTILAIADRLAAFGPTTRSATEITARERRLLSDALEQNAPGSELLVAELGSLGIVGILFLETRRDYFTDDAHGHVSILAVGREAEGKGVGSELLKEAERWGRRQGFRRLTLSVFADNHRAKEPCARQGARGLFCGGLTNVRADVIAKGRSAGPNWRNVDPIQEKRPSGKS